MEQTPATTPNLGLNQWTDAMDPVNMEQFTEDNKIVDSAIGDILHPSASTTREINDVPIGELQAVIDSLPRLLPENITINVLPGTVDTDLVIRGFSGPCSLNINGAETRDTTTHNVSRVIIEYCTCRIVRMAGITATFSGEGTAWGIYAGFNSAIVRFFQCNIVNTGAHGITLSVTPAVLIQNCMISNRSSAIEAWESRVRVMNLSGVNNGRLYSGRPGGFIGVESEGTIQRSATGNYAVVGGGGIVIDSFGRRYVGTTGGGGAGLAPNQTLTVDIVDLRNTIRALPRHLTNNITINVLPGTTNDVIDLVGFSGPGQLRVNAHDTDGNLVLINNPTTHSVARFFLENNSIPVIIRGFRCTASAGGHQAGICVVSCSAYVKFYHMSIVQNPNMAARTGYGINVITSTADIESCTISGQNIAARSSHSRLTTRSLVGTGNERVLLATFGGDLNMIDNSLPDGNIVFTQNHGGAIRTPSGGRNVFLPAQNGNIDIGSASSRFRTLFATTGTINTSDEREKADITPLSEDLLDFFMQLNPVSFKRKDDEHNETHFGLIAQEVEKAINGYQSPDKLQAFGEPVANMPCNFGGLTKHELTEIVDTGEVHEIKTPIKRMVKKAVPQPMSSSLNSADMEGLNIADYEEYEEIDDFEITTEPITEERVIGDRYGIRYSEFIPLLIKMVQMQQKEIEVLKSNV